MSAAARLRVAVIYGGPSAEAEVSRVSSRAVAGALTERGHRVTELELGVSLAERLRELSPQVVFPVTHGTLGEDGCLQGLLEVLALPYVGSGVLGSALGANKVLAKLLFASVGLPVAPQVVVHAHEDLERAAAVAYQSLGLGWVVKPGNGGSALGVRRIAAGATVAELATSIREGLAEDSEVLIEPWVSGLEVTCGVLEETTGAPRALPPTLIVPKAADWYDFRSKYAAGGSEHTCPAPFAPELLERIAACAVDAHRAIRARDLSRADFVVSGPEADARLILLETNTLPGMTATSLFPEAALAQGIAFPDLCERLLRLALHRPRPAVQAAPMP